MTVVFGLFRKFPQLSTPNAQLSMLKVRMFALSLQKAYLQMQKTNHAEN
jgi:hypothetical protein